MSGLHADIEKLLKLRFRHLDLERCKPLLHPEQPANGLHRVKGDGEYPAVLMSTGTWWFADRGARPLNKQGDPMKSQAPSIKRKGESAKALLVDDASAKAVVVVEGEGQAMALRSVGFIGVVCVGGVKTLLANSPAAREQRRAAFAGKDVRILFDFDAAGQDAAPKAAKKILEATATRVAVVERPADWPESVDVEDWLGAFETPEQGRGALLAILGGARWLTAEDLKAAASDEEAASLVIIEARVPVDESRDAFVATVYDEEARKIRLAVWGPEAQPAPLRHPGESVQHDAVDETFAWRLVDEWSWAGQRYVPNRAPEFLEMHNDRMLVIPAPPVENPGTWEEIWRDVRDYIDRWVVVGQEHELDVLTAYVFLSYRIWDERLFEHCPYIRLIGRTGKGKSWLMKVLRELCWRAYWALPSGSNLHRFMDYMRSVTLLADEFHPDRAGREAAQSLAEILCLGSDRAGNVVRCNSRPNGEIVPKSFRVFGPKAFTGYDRISEQGLDRRTISFDMAAPRLGDRKPDPLDAVPPQARTEGYAIRSRLLTWRLQMMGQPTDRARYPRLRDRAGDEGTQYFWPLAAMIPPSMDDAFERLLLAVNAQHRAAEQLRHVGEDAVLLGGMSKAQSIPLTVSGEHHRFVTTKSIHEAATGGATAPRNELRAIGIRLADLGFVPYRDGARGPRGWLVPVGGMKVFEDYGVSWVVSGQGPC